MQHLFEYNRENEKKTSPFPPHEKCNQNEKGNKNKNLEGTGCYTKKPATCVHPIPHRYSSMYHVGALIVVQKERGFIIKST